MYCLQAAIDAKGGNMYPRHRPADVKAAAHGPVVQEPPPESGSVVQCPHTGIARRIYLGTLSKVFGGRGTLCGAV